MPRPKGFYTTTMHSKELHEVLLQIKNPAEVNKKFSSELRHIAWSMGVAIPFLPFRGIEETNNFSTLLLKNTIFENALVIEWSTHIHGIQSFLSTKWEHTPCVKMQ
jgi:hypothetical protein